MKETNFVSSALCGDPMFRLTLAQFLELKKELEVKKRKLEMVKRRRLTLKAEVRFLRRRYKHLKQDQILVLPESGGLEVPRKPGGERKEHSCVGASVPCFDLKEKNTICNEKETVANHASCDLEKKLKRSRGNDILTNSVSLPDLDGDENTSVTNQVPGFDLNKISREEEEPEANGGNVVAEAVKNAMLENRISDLHEKRKLPICVDVEKVLNRAVKRKVSWQDPVALSI